MAKRRKKQGSRKSTSRRLSLKLGVTLLGFLILWGLCGEWYVHHPRKWLSQKYATWPRAITTPLYWIGNPVADITDALDWTGHDAVYEYDTEAPAGEVLFAGAPKRVNDPAPNDIRIIDRGEFVIGWSDKLRHPYWCAYHVTQDAKYDLPERPSFTKDRTLPLSPSPNDYTKSGYDRGHMAPNYAIATRYGVDEQRKTFMMSNIAPQTPALNRGVWRDVEHRIADYWSARYGEIWVIVGCVPSYQTSLPGTDIEVPSAYYQIIIAQEEMEVRAIAMLFRQRISWHEWAARNIVSISEIEELTGLDFNPDLPSFIQDPLESELPSRLWPVKLRHVFSLILNRFF